MKKKKQKAFTLIEMLIVLFIIAILLVITMPNIAKKREMAQEKADQAIIKIIDQQKELYQIEYPSGGEPSVDTLLTEGYITSDQVEAYNAALSRGGQ